MTTGKTIALTSWTFVGKVMSLLSNMLCRLVITFLPRTKHLLISWLQSPSDGSSHSLQSAAICSQGNFLRRIHSFFSVLTSLLSMDSSTHRVPRQFLLLYHGDSCFAIYLTYHSLFKKKKKRLLSI